MTDPSVVASFTEHFKQYYQQFDADRSQLANFYHEQSQLNFENSTAILGKDAIMAKLNGLPFQKIAHAITTTDVQLTIDGGVLIHVVGQLKTDEDPAMPFTQTFLLKQRNGQMFIDNDIFRLGVHNF